VLLGDAMGIADVLVLLTISLAAPAHAQTEKGTIAGIVIDDRTEQPIRGVSVYLENQPVVVETDANGRFSLDALRGRQTIAASVYQCRPRCHPRPTEKTRDGAYWRVVTTPDLE